MPGFYFLLADGLPSVAFRAFQLQKIFYRNELLNFSPHFVQNYWADFDETLYALSTHPGDDKKTIKKKYPVFWKKFFPISRIFFSSWKATEGRRSASYDYI